MAEALPHFPPFDTRRKTPSLEEIHNQIQEPHGCYEYHRRCKTKRITSTLLFDTLPNTEAAEDENTVTKAIDALTVHFEDKKSIVFSKNTSLDKRGKKITKRSKLTILVSRNFLRCANSQSLIVKLKHQSSSLDAKA